MKKNIKQLQEDFDELYLTLSLGLNRRLDLLLLKSLFVDKIVMLNDFKTELNRYGYEDAEGLYRGFINSGLLEEVEYKKETKYYNYIYIKSTEKLKNMVLEDRYNSIKVLVELKEAIDNKKNKLKEITESKDILDGYNKAINQHHNMEHFHSINCLYQICTKENIPCNNIFKQVKAKVMKEPRVFVYKNYKNVEPDLSIIYNKKTVFIEVERGNTIEKDMYDKLTKYQLLDRTNQPKMDVVIIAAPNKKDLDATKKKVEKWEEQYDYDYKVYNVDVMRDLKFIYLNIATINGKNTLRKFLYNQFRK